MTRFTAVLGLAAGLFFFTAHGAGAADAQHPDFSPKDRQADISGLRDFFYPPGYSDDTIVALENGRVPADMTVAEFARVHCGESAHFVLNPCLVRYGTSKGTEYFVVVPGGNKHFTDAAAATRYFSEKLSDTLMAFGSEVMALNDFIEDFCIQVEDGANARDVLSRKGDRPRLNHAIAPPDPDGKYPFSNLFQWTKCSSCVGIVAVRQEGEAQDPRCGNVRKQNVPQVSYFVVDRLTSRGYGSLNDGLKDFGVKVGMK
jgi:hypothetical protein